MNQHQTLTDLRRHIASCDRSAARDLPRQLYSYIAEILDNEEPGVYVIECIPALCVTLQVLLRALGTFNPNYTSDIDIGEARRHLLDTLETFEDELRLNRESQPALRRQA